MADHTASSYSLKRSLVMGFVPVLLLLSGCMLASVYLSYEIHALVASTSTTATDKIQYAQMTAGKLSSVSQSLQTLTDSLDPEEAREAYVSTWKLLSEAALDRHEEMHEPLYLLLKETRQAWIERQEADEAFSRFIESYRNLDAQLFRTIALIGPSKTDRSGKLARSLVLSHEVDHIARYKAVRKVAFGICAEPNARLIDKAAASCERITAIVSELDSIAEDYSGKKAVFQNHVASIRLDLQVLYDNYNTLEIRQLKSEVGKLDELSDSFMLLFFAQLIAAGVMISALVYGYRLLIRPIQQTTSMLGRSMKNDDAASVGPAASPITEIQDFINQSRQIVQYTASERDKTAKLQARYDELRKSAQIDSLTGVNNRASLDELIVNLPQVRDGIAVLMVDIDFFKDINDRYGHQFGDRILHATAQTLRRFISSQDTVYRYGGEEFCIVLLNVTQAAAMLVANRLCARVREISRETGTAVPDIESGTPLTISIGVSSVTRFLGEKTLPELIAEADTALYRAKDAGRNCVRTR